MEKRQRPRRPGRPDIAFFAGFSTPVAAAIILETSCRRTNAIFLKNKRHHPEEETERVNPP
jgi:hypothetical protein